MEIFKQLKKLGYKHYIDLTIDELDKLPIDCIEKKIEYSLVIDWFREKYNIHISVKSDLARITAYQYIIVTDYILSEFGNMGDSYYIAREQAILKAIELCQKEK